MRHEEGGREGGREGRKKGRRRGERERVTIKKRYTRKENRYIKEIALVVTPPPPPTYSLNSK